MVLARIDDLVYAADAAQAEAQVRSGRAALQRARPTWGQLQARLQQAERDWQRARKLGPSEALAEASFDAYRSAYETAVANVEVGRATIQQAEAAGRPGRGRPQQGQTQPRATARSPPP